MLVIDKNHHLALIKDTFRNKNIQVSKEENFDDNYWGWKIGITPGEFIIYKVSVNNYRNIHIIFVKTVYHSNIPQNPVNTSYKDIFKGSIPLMEEDDIPDFNFVEKLLKNYTNVGGY